MQWLFDAMAQMLAVFYSIIPSYGFAIILLTVVVMIIVTPLTLKGTRSMMLMQQMQPEIRKLQEKHKGDRQKLNEELMALYKENQINPVGGCLPLLVQAPVFIVLYTVLRGLTRRVSDLGYATGWSVGGVDLGSLVKPPEWLRTFDPAYLSPDTDLYQSLSQATEMRWLGMDLAASPQRALSESIVSFIPYALLILVVAVTGFVQQRQIQGRVPKGQVNSQQQMIMKFLPIMLPIFSFTLPGGLVLYFAVSNLYRVGQQWFISRRIYGLKRGEDIDKKRARESGTVETTAALVGDAPVDGSRRNGKADRADKAYKESGELPAAKSNGKAVATKDAGRSGGRGGGSTKGKGSAKGGAKGSASRGARGSRGGGRSTPKSTPTPSVQPRGRKKKR